MKRTLTIAGLGVAGMALAVALSVAAFALVGEPLSEPATGIRVPVATVSNSPNDGTTRTETPDPATPSPSTSPADDHGGDNGNSGSGGGGGSEPGDDHGGGSGGHGSDD